MARLAGEFDDTDAGRAAAGEALEEALAEARRQGGEAGGWVSPPTGGKLRVFVDAPGPAGPVTY